MSRHDLPNGTIHEADWLTVDLDPGYSLAIIDGPYGMGKAAWDRMKVEGLAEWYRPHLERVSMLLAESASVYLWGSDESEGRLRPLMRSLGWTFTGSIVWDKAGGLAGNSRSPFADCTERCGMWHRGTPPMHRQMRPATDARATEWGVTSIWRVAGRTQAPERLRHPSKTTTNNGVTGYGKWAAPLHPCQKPLLFAERMIRASTRPGDRILVPFGGTCREAVVCEWMARKDPAEARRYDVCELNQDGVDYIGPVLAQIAGRPRLSNDDGQTTLFGATA